VCAFVGVQLREERTLKRRREIRDLSRKKFNLFKYGYDKESEKEKVFTDILENKVVCYNSLWLGFAWSSR
jgi:hypothetical protein